MFYYILLFLLLHVFYNQGLHYNNARLVSSPVPQSAYFLTHKRQHNIRKNKIFCQVVGKEPIRIKIIILTSTLLTEINKEHNIEIHYNSNKKKKSSNLVECKLNET